MCFEEPPKALLQPPNITDEAIRLRDLATKKGVYRIMQEMCGGAAIEVPFRNRMSKMKIEEMNLSVRSSNCLMRAKASTFGELWELMCNEHGLRAVRNLGAKSEAEIQRCFLVACYSLLSHDEQAAFWQKIVDLDNSDIKKMF